MSFDQLPMSAFCGRELAISYPCSLGSVQLRFILLQQELRSTLADFQKAMRLLGPKALVPYTKEVWLVVKLKTEKKRQISARFTSEECASLLGDFWPHDGSFGRIVAAINVKKGNPDPAYQIPWEAGKSLTAQGQTKKPGSHSESRHKPR